MWYDFRIKIIYKNNEIGVEYRESFCANRDEIWKERGRLKKLFEEHELIQSVEIQEKAQ